MSFSTKLFLAGFFLLLFTFGFGYYQSHHPWPNPLAMYPCFAAVALAGLFLYATPNSHH